MTTTQQTAWPEGVIDRYRTVGGATVDITETKSGEYTSTPPERPELMRYYTAYPVVDLTFKAVCGGCRDSKSIECEEVDADHAGCYLDRLTCYWSNPKDWAQKHAETCRAMPRPDGA